jgi:hypothetical protein
VYNNHDLNVGEIFFNVNAFNGTWVNKT